MPYQGMGSAPIVVADRSHLMQRFASARARARAHARARARARARCFFEALPWQSWVEAVAIVANQFSDRPS